MSGDVGRNTNKPLGRPMGGPMGGGPGRMMMPGDKAKDFKASALKLFNYFGKYKAATGFVVCLAIASAVFSIVGPKIMGQATDELVKGVMASVSGRGGIDFGRIAQIMTMLIVFYSISAVFSYVQGFIMTGITNKLTFRMRNDIIDKIHKLPLKYYDRVTHGEALSRITNDVDTINQSLNQSLTQIITSVTSVTGIMIMMLTISWQLTLAALLILPVSMLAIILIVKKSQKYFTSQQELLGHINGHIEEMYGNHIIVKSFNGEEKSKAEFKRFNDSLYHSTWKSNFLSGLMMPITMFVGNLGYVAVCILGGRLAVSGAISVGDIQSFIQYMRSFTQPISQIANISNVLQQTAAAAERVFEFLDEQEEIPDGSNALTVNRGNHSDTETCVSVKGKVAFNHVGFGYDDNKTVIHDFNAAVEPGQKIAIVGPTGAGKTTIVKLLMRFYDVQRGTISVDGHDIKLFKRNDLRSLFGMVLQDTWLFNGTIDDNIRYGNLSASAAEVEKAARAAQVDHFVHTLPDGYNMILNEEASNISQGQKQLLTIARAILADPEILILDEATSSVDTRTEVLIQKAMDNLMKGRTSFIIAHRLSTIRNADLILVMREGDIVEQGSHDDLMERNGFYASLYNSQFDRISDSI